MRLLKFLWVWLRRIPARFSVPFFVVLLLYLWGLSKLFEWIDVPRIADEVGHWLTNSGVPDFIMGWIVVKVLLQGIVILVLFVFGILFSYNAAVSGYKHWRAAPAPLSITLADPAPQQVGKLEKFSRIGLILAGGGAKGAYQAGALKAIYEFLEQNGALDKVKMIAGTSIGSWNAMFWLAGLIKPSAPGAMSTHEQWWKSISVGRIAEFDTYWPLRANHFLLTTPWREAFRQVFHDSRVKQRLADLFVQAGSGDDPRLHFYLTRSNVMLGRLSFATNWPGIRGSDVKNLRREDPNKVEMVKVRPDTYELIETSKLDEALERTERAVFASMDLPPLFPYMMVRGTRDDWFEDGGVVDNVPVWFGTNVEKCDLLFILPLNSSFAEDVDHTSLIRRVFRVMDVRQGVLERNSMKLAYLYNELAALREEIRQLRTSAQTASVAKPDLVTRALNRGNTPVSVFSICPQKPLLIETQEFWNPEAAGQAFDVMYTATRNELEINFERNTDPNWVRMILVDSHGEISSMEDF